MEDSKVDDITEATNLRPDDLDSSDNHLSSSPSVESSPNTVVMSKRKRKKLEQQIKKKEHLKEKRYLIVFDM